MSNRPHTDQIFTFPVITLQLKRHLRDPFGDAHMGVMFCHSKQILACIHTVTLTKLEGWFIQVKPFPE